MQRAYIKDVLYLYEKDYLESALQLTSYCCLGASLLAFFWACHPVATSPLSTLTLANYHDCITQAFSYKDQPLGFRVLVIGVGAYGLKTLLHNFGNKTVHF